jgi:hypothetical protein
MVRTLFFLHKYGANRCIRPVGLGRSSKTYTKMALARFMLKVGKADCPE